MSLQIFINELQQRALLSERQLSKLSEAAVERQMSPKQLASFLVQKNHVTQQQAADVLQAVLSAGGDPDVASPATVVSEPVSGFQLDPPELSLAPVYNANDMENSDEDAGTSSVFASYLTTPQSKTPPPPVAQDDELILLADATEEVPPKTVREPSVVRSPVESNQWTKDSIPDTSEEVSLPEPTAAASSAEPLDTIVTPRMTTTLSRSKKKKKAGKKAKPPSKKSKSERKWDTPLILLGGGGLLLLLLIGGLIWWLMNRESAEQQLASARAARDKGAYSEAIKQYQDFVAGAASHPEHERARIELAMLRIRQPMEAGDFAQALDTAEKQLKEIEVSEKFHEAHGELAALLPQIARGLADQTEKAEPGSAEVAANAELANKALELCSNATYLPKALRDEGKLTAVLETLELVKRRSATKQALDDALKTMQDALAGGDTNKVYVTYAELLRARTELANNPALAEILKKATEAERTAIRLVSQEQAAETAERPTPWIASLAMANRRIQPQANVPTTGATTACFKIGSAVYALDAASGKLLWGRQVGYSHPLWPQLIGEDVLIADTVHNELLRLDSRTGQLKWRQSLGDAFAQPLIVGERAFISSDSGRLYVVDLNSGTRVGYLQFAQPLRSPPAVDRTSEHLYLVGDHSSVYTISLKDLSCLGVHYLGHAVGSVVQSPTAVMDKIAILENDGIETSRLRLLSLRDDGTVDAQAAERRLAGLASASPYVSGRRLVVITDRGQVDAYDIGSGKGEEPLTVVATRAAPSTKSVIRYALLADKNIWVGDTQLTKYSILPTGNRLPVEAIENNFSGATFDHPLVLQGDAIIHVRRAPGRAGVVVAATSTAQGATLWETDLAIPPAGAPVVDEASKSIAVGNAEGYLFRFDEAAIRARVQDEPLAAQAMPAKLPALTDSVDLGRGRAAFSGVGSTQYLLYNPELGQSAAKWISLDGPLACPLTALGEGIVAPLTIGQVFYMSATDGSKLAIPFQPTLAPQTEWHYKQAGAIEGGVPRFVIADGQGKIYFVALADQPQPHLAAAAVADAGPHPIDSPLVILAESALAIGDSSRLLRFKLPSLEPAGDSNLSAPVIAGPFRLNDTMLIATADNQLIAIGADGQVKWQAPVEHGDLAGAPLLQGDEFLVAYKKGAIERRSLADGKPIATKDIEQPLASGPVVFLQRLVISTNDGTLLVVDQP